MNVREFRANLAAVLARVEAGETVEITKRGRVVAKVGPVEVGPAVRVVTDSDEYPVGEWYRRPWWPEGKASIDQQGDASSGEYDVVIDGNGS